MEPPSSINKNSTEAEPEESPKRQKLDSETASASRPNAPTTSSLPVAGPSRNLRSNNRVIEEVPNSDKQTISGGSANPREARSRRTRSYRTSNRTQDDELVEDMEVSANLEVTTERNEGTVGVADTWPLTDFAEDSSALEEAIGETWNRALNTRQTERNFLDLIFPPPRDQNSAIPNINDEPIESSVDEESAEEDANGHGNNFGSHDQSMESNAEHEEEEEEAMIFNEDSDDDSDSSTYPSHSRFTDRDRKLLNELVAKPKLKYDWNLKEILLRENGFATKNPITDFRCESTFRSRFYSSRHIVEKFKVIYKLSKHNGCVNSLNFNKSGSHLVTGSDDLKIIIWNWAGNKIVQSFKSGHTSNIFQTKFVELNNNSASIVSSARDGTVRFSQIPPSGLTKIQPKKLYSHSSAVHKIALNPSDPCEILSAGEDGYIYNCDLRTNKPNQLAILTIPKTPRKIRLYSISHHPFNNEVCVAGTDASVHVFDKRSFKKPLHKMFPENLKNLNKDPHITCALYSNAGDEILASYSNENAYLYQTKGYVPGTYKHLYCGHMNSKTIKGINFFGPNSEYVVSGSDCGNVIMWDKNNESIINYFKGDKTTVNCLEPHPTYPILAVSGLDYNVKIVSPESVDELFTNKALKTMLERNMRRHLWFENSGGSNMILNIFQEYLRNREREYITGEESSSDPFTMDITNSTDSESIEDDDDDNDDDISP